MAKTTDRKNIAVFLARLVPQFSTRWVDSYDKSQDINSHGKKTYQLILIPKRVKGQLKQAARGSIEITSIPTVWNNLGQTITVEYR